jgi:hypothetical protein
MEADEHDEKPVRPAVEMLRIAIQTISNRAGSYGPPGEHFARTCAAANAILGDLFARPMTPSDWARLMILDKLARDAEVAKIDNVLDIAGYAACLAEVRHWDARNNTFKETP